MDNYSIGKEKRKQLLLMLCQHEADRLEVWAQPLNKKLVFKILSSLAFFKQHNIYYLLSIVMFFPTEITYLVLKLGQINGLNM